VEVCLVAAILRHLTRDPVRRGDARDTLRHHLRLSELRLPVLAGRIGNRREPPFLI